MLPRQHITRFWRYVITLPTYLFPQCYCDGDVTDYSGFSSGIKSITGEVYWLVQTCDKTKRFCISPNTDPGVANHGMWTCILNWNCYKKNTALNLLTCVCVCLDLFWAGDKHPEHSCSSDRRPTGRHRAGPGETTHPGRGPDNRPYWGPGPGVLQHCVCHIKTLCLSHCVWW